MHNRLRWVGALVAVGLVAVAVSIWLGVQAYMEHPEPPTCEKGYPNASTVVIVDGVITRQQQAGGGLNISPEVVADSADYATLVVVKLTPAASERLFGWWVREGVNDWKLVRGHEVSISKVGHVLIAMFGQDPSVCEPGPVLGFDPLTLKQRGQWPDAS